MPSIKSDPFATPFPHSQNPMNLRRDFFIVIALVCLSSSISTAENPDAQSDIQKQINAGFESYKTEGGEGAWKSWCLLALPMEGAHDSFIGNLAHMEQYFGKPTKVEFIKKLEISPSYCKYYYLWGFEKQAVFVEFICYQPNDKWLILHVKLDTDVKKVPDN
jgi:hypothetical protein